jgi:16S rRNA (uracil1498-N3)-methyltransferase
MLRRFFVPDAALLADARVTVDGDEGRHIARVLRAVPGDLLELFDGRGGAAEAEVTTVGRNEVECVVRAVADPADGSGLPELHIGVALPKGDRQKWLVEKATELGVTCITPLTSERSVAAPGKAVERLQRTVIEACKQCRRNRLLEILPPQPVADFFAQADRNALRLIADPGGTGIGEIAPTPTAFVAIGPEGGFSPPEVEQAVAAGWQAVSLGPTILRVETAVAAVAAWVRLARV